MKQLAEDVWQLEGRPPDMVNVYLVGDVLIDAGTRFDCKRILRQLDGRRLTAHALTHAHPDHLGSSHAVCERFDVPFWVGAYDAAAAEDPQKLVSGLRPDALSGSKLPLDPLLRLYVRSQVTEGQPVARTLGEGDQVAGFTVLDVPGHTPGHIAFWRETDRTLIAGDVLWNFQFVGGKPGLTQPAPTSNVDSARNRESARRLAALQPKLVCFGHGPVLRDTRRFVEFIDSLPRP